MKDGFGDYYNLTVIHPLALVVLGILSLWMILSPRRTALLPILIVSVFISPAQRLVVVGLDFTMLRILLLVGFVRIIVRSEVRILRWTRMDTLLVTFVLVTAAILMARVGSTAALINRLGYLYDVFGLYLLFRILLRDWDDLRTVVRCLIWLSIPVAVFFLIERSTGHNMFAIFGGVPEITPIREGKLRCMGAFAHPIIAGVFWAVLMPMFMSEFWRGRGDRMLSILGLVSCIFIIMATNSSTPFAATGLVVAGFCSYPFRRLMNLVLWGSAFMIVCVHFYREGPVWSLLSQLDLVGGSTGYHRYLLIEGAVTTFPQWWLMGAYESVRETAGFHDITNQFIFYAVQGGLLSLVLFLCLIICAFRTCWIALWRAGLTFHQKMMVWGMFVIMGVHSAIFIAVSYFGQGPTVFHMQLAIIASLPALLESRSAKEERERYREDRVRFYNLETVRVWPVA